MKPVLVSSGEPAGIGPDICLALATSNLPVVVMGDWKMLAERAELLQLNIEFCEYQPDEPYRYRPNLLTVYPISCAHPVIAGKLDTKNSPYVINMLTTAVEACLQEEFSALVTAPVNKAIINQAGIPFTGHTEFLADYCKTETVVMMLACETMKLALITTHLPLLAVATNITSSLIINVITQLDITLKTDFGITTPTIYVTGLNPHAGEGGYLGREEIDTIIPALDQLREQGINAIGPLPADTIFIPENVKQADVFVAMYHDQGLPVLKYAGFGHAVNITLGLPVIRTSVDHGTALDLAGTGQAEANSLLAAVTTAISIVKMRKRHEKN